MTSAMLNIGSRALAAAQGTLSTVSHNIANANTEGYSRQEAQLSTAGGLFSGSGFYGRGVDLTSVQRRYDQFLVNAVQSASAVAGADVARSEGLAALDGLFGDSTLGLGASLDQLFAAAGDLAARPADASVRQVFLARAGQLASRFTSFGREIENLMRQADQVLAQGAQDANTHLGAIRRLNVQISQSQASGHPPNDLLDQRDAAVQKLSGLLAVQTMVQPDGSLGVFTLSGAPLVIGTQVARLEPQPDATDNSRTALALVVGGTRQVLDATALGGGSLAGTLRLRDEDLAPTLDQVGRMAHQVAKAFNQQQAAGLDANGVSGLALFRLPPPQVLAHGGNGGGATLGATVANSDALQPSDYQVQWDGTNYTVTRLSDNMKFPPVADLSAPVDGLQLQLDGAPAAGDQWRIKRMGPAATGLSVEPITPRQVATALPATGQSEVGNKGSGIIKSVMQLAEPPLPDGSVTIRFTDATTYDVTLPDGTTLTGQSVEGDTIPAAPAHYNGWAVKMDGKPAPGDSFKLLRVTSPGADNRNALAFQQLMNAELLDGSTLNNSYASLLGTVGVRVQTARAATEVSSQLQTEVISRQQNVSGVNLDEEASNLLRFQQQYQASARIVQTSQSLFDTLLSATGR